MVGPKPVSRAPGIVVALLRAGRRRIAEVVPELRRDRLAWQPQRWSTGVQPCSEPVGAWWSPSGVACAQCPSVTR